MFLAGTQELKLQANISVHGEMIFSSADEWCVMSAEDTEKNTKNSVISVLNTG